MKNPCLNQCYQNRTGGRTGQPREPEPDWNRTKTGKQTRSKNRLSKNTLNIHIFNIYRYIHVHPCEFIRRPVPNEVQKGEWKSCVICRIIDDGNNKNTYAISWSSTSLYYSPKCKYSSTCNNKIDNYDSRNPSTAYMYSIITSHSVFIATFDNEQQYTQWYQLCVKTWFLMHVYGLIHISVMILVKHSFWIRKNREHSIKSTQPYCVWDCVQTMCI